MRRLVFRRRLRRHELVQRLPQAAPSTGRRCARRSRGARCCGWRRLGHARYSAAARSGASRASGARAAGRGESVEQLHRHRILERPCSGCHCSASAKAGASGTLKASTWPSSATASSRARGARRSTPWACSEFTCHAALAQQAMQQAAFDDVDVVRRRIVDVGVGRLGRAMVAPAFDLVHQLMQRAAQRHVDFLQAAADREQRHAAIDRMADQRQRGGVARRIVRGARPAVLASHSDAARRWTGCRSAARRPGCRAGGRAPRSWPSRHRRIRRPMAGIRTGRPPTAWIAARTYLSPTV